MKIDNIENNAVKSNLKFDKPTIRNTIITQCKSLDHVYYANVATAVCSYSKPLLDKATTIAIYHARKWEANLKPIIEYAQKKHKILYHPIAYREHKVMLFEEYIVNTMPMFMPFDYIPHRQIPWYNLDLIFLPLIAVDKVGIRLGNGGGYYDTTLSEIINIPKTNKRPILCGVGFYCQMVDILPRDKWDISLDYFVSENGLYRF